MSRDTTAFDDDGFLPVLLPIAIPLVLMLVIGIVYAPLLWWVLMLAILLSTGTAVFLVAKLLQKCIRENCGEGGVLEAWRPSAWVGLRTACSVLIRWMPFGFVAVLLFCVHGIIVDELAQLVEAGILKLQRLNHIGIEQVEGLPWYYSFFAPTWLTDSATASLSAVDRFLLGILRVIRILIAFEHFLSWVFLVWLTVRSVLYFLARLVLSEAHARSEAEAAMIEVRFDMEFTR
ncbi:MAG: hypothetical protein RLY21_467 [Planctomycetota bacterium]